MVDSKMVVVQVKPLKTMALGDIEVEFKGKTFTPDSGVDRLIIRGAGARGKEPGEPGDIIMVPEYIYLRNKNFLELVVIPADSVPETKPAAKPPTEPEELPTEEAATDTTPEPGASIGSPSEMSKRDRLVAVGKQKGGYKALKEMARKAGIAFRGNPKKDWLIDELMRKG